MLVVFLKESPNACPFHLFHLFLFVTPATRPHPVSNLFLSKPSSSPTFSLLVRSFSPKPSRRRPILVRTKLARLTVSSSVHVATGRHLFIRASRHRSLSLHSTVRRLFVRATVPQAATDRRLFVRASHHRLPSLHPCKPSSIVISSSAQAATDCRLFVRASRHRSQSLRPCKPPSIAVSSSAQAAINCLPRLRV